jgi:hypothetical protein
MSNRNERGTDEFTRAIAKYYSPTGPQNKRIKDQGGHIVAKSNT